MTVARKCIAFRLTLAACRPWHAYPIEAGGLEFSGWAAARSCSGVNDRTRWRPEASLLDFGRAPGGLFGTSQRGGSYDGSGSARPFRLMN